MRMTERGQITVPKRLRQKYGLNQHVDVEVVERDGKLLILKGQNGASPVDQAYGMLKAGESTDEYIKAIRGR